MKKQYLTILILSSIVILALLGFYLNYLPLPKNPRTLSMIKFIGMFIIAGTLYAFLEYILEKTLLKNKQNKAIIKNIFRWIIFLICFYGIFYKGLMDLAGI